jgi:hypothetical protein
VEGSGRPIGIELLQEAVRFEAGSEIRQVHVTVADCQQHLAQRGEGSGCVAAEMVGEDQVDCGARFRLMLVVPVGYVPTATAGDLIRGEAGQEEVLLS